MCSLWTTYFRFPVLRPCVLLKKKEQHSVNHSEGRESSCDARGIKLMCVNCLDGKGRTDLLFDQIRFVMFKATVLIVAY